MSDAESLEELAEQATLAAYSDDAVGADPARCEHLRTDVQRAALAQLSAPRRIVWRLRPA
jgi:hypothetical protein